MTRKKYIKKLAINLFPYHWRSSIVLMTITDIFNYFKEQLIPLYNPKEIDCFVYLGLEHVLGFSRNDVFQRVSSANWQIDTMPIGKKVQNKLNKIVSDLKQHKPIQYILGSTDFYGINLRVTPTVMIPRPETEELVKLIIQDILMTSPPSPRLQERGVVGERSLSVLDVGTGSGCIAIALKKHLPRAKVFAIDISEPALKIARFNARKNFTQIKFIKADVFNNDDLKTLPKFDIIVSNPPYIRESEKRTMSKNVLNYEPHQALFVSDDEPLIFYSHILDFAKKQLKKYSSSSHKMERIRTPAIYRRLEDTTVYFEINENLGEQIRQLAKNKGFENIDLFKDINGKDRFVKVSYRISY